MEKSCIIERFVPVCHLFERMLKPGCSALSYSLLLFVITTGVIGKPQWNWSSITLDSTADVGRHNSLALDRNGYPHICYYDFTNRSLKYTWWDGSQWRYEVVDSTGDSGWYCSLVIDKAGIPHVAYLDAAVGVLKYASRIQFPWTVEVVSVPISGWDASLALDGMDQPHIIYTSRNEIGWPLTMNHAYRNGSTWESESIRSVSVSGSLCSLAINDQNILMVAYNLNNLQTLEFAWFENETWKFETIEYTPARSLYPSLALDRDGWPCVSYAVRFSGEVGYAKMNEDGWSSQTIAKFSKPDERPSTLAFDPHNRPHICYNSDKIGLMHTWWDGREWNTEMIDSVRDSAGTLSLKFDARGNAHLCSWQFLERTLRYAYGEVQQPFNIAPIANAGVDQTVYAPMDGGVEIQLDGASSYDQDDDKLDYTWRWEIEGTVFEATGVNPSIQLPVGDHHITLTVNDGIVDSNPDSVCIQVIKPLRVNLFVIPKTLNRQSGIKYLTGMLSLPKDLDIGDINFNESFTIYPGKLLASSIRTAGKGNSGKIFVLYNINDILSVVPNAGNVEFTIEGKLHSGQYLFGKDTIQITKPNSVTPQSDKPNRPGTLKRR